MWWERNRRFSWCWWRHPLHVMVMVLGILFPQVMVQASEFPGRECCESAPPLPPHYHTVTSTSTTTTTAHPPTNVPGRGRVEVSPLNCMVAKQLCHENANCSAVLKVVPTLCGPELVSCSTVTVSRCQAALRTLASFAWFHPTCLCPEPRSDPQCNTFKDLIFDHPCVFVDRKEVDMHPMQYIPTCEIAAGICRDNPWCKQRLESFRNTCKFRDGHCRNPDREDCMKAWLQLRVTPLLGCICPNGDDKKKCSRLYSLVNENPCVELRYASRVEEMDLVSNTLISSITQSVPIPTPGAASLIVVSLPARDTSYPPDSFSFYHTNNNINNNNNNDYDSMTDHKITLDQLSQLASTCHEALRECQKTPVCKRHFETVTSMCDTSFCQQVACRDAIQNLYKNLMDGNQDLALMMALCVCRETGDIDEEECERAQRRLHPQCAEMVENKSISQCNRLGRSCRNDRVCRYRLEYYEQACAADTMTGRCAGQHVECTKAMMGLLGTDLHTNCVCKGDSFFNIKHCLDWKRLLWGNPCVVESQLTYHLARAGHDVNIDPYRILNKDRMKSRHRDQDFRDQGEGGGPSAYPEEFDNNDIATRLTPRKVAASTPQSDHTPHASILAAPSSSSSSYSSTTTTTMMTTTTTPTTTLPEKYCEVRRPSDSATHIVEEGGGIRLYKDGDKDCSEICFCHYKETKCKVLDCVENLPCETKVAVYNHDAPGYQANRGECICYSGNFICMRPPKDEHHHLPAGLFLLLGFSKTEENILRPVTEGGAVDAIPPLQKIVRATASALNEECRVNLYQHTSDNLVLRVRHFQISSEVENNSYTLHMLQEERDRCIEPLRKVAKMINNRDAQIRHHIHMSLFVLAEVLDNVPDFQRISPGDRPSGTNLALLLGSLAALLCHTRWSLQALRPS